MRSAKGPRHILQAFRSQAWQRVLARLLHPRSTTSGIDDYANATTVGVFFLNIKAFYMSIVSLELYTPSRGQQQKFLIP